MAASPADRMRSRGSVRTAVVWEVLRAALAERLAGAAAHAGLDVLDAGGGTGGFAVPLAELGHRVTVVDPSPDSLAALERRAAEAGVSASVRGVQGDVASLGELPAGELEAFDVVLCHSVLEYVDDPATAVAALAAALRPRGFASVLVANRTGVVLARALAGHFDEAAGALHDPAGRWGETDALARRFSAAELTALLAGAGLRVGPLHGIRVFADLVPGALLDGDPTAVRRLLALEEAVAERPEFRDIATQLHALASRS